MTNAALQNEIGNKRFGHLVNGQVFYSLIGEYETLAEYRGVIKKEYGSLKGIKFFEENA